MSLSPLLFWCNVVSLCSHKHISDAKVVPGLSIRTHTWPHGEGVQLRAATQEKLYEGQQTKLQRVGSGCCPGGGTWAPTRREKPPTPRAQERKPGYVSGGPGGCRGQSGRLPGTAQSSPDQVPAHTFSSGSGQQQQQPRGRPGRGPPRRHEHACGRWAAPSRLRRGRSRSPPARCPGLPAGSAPPGPARSQPGPAARPSRRLFPSCALGAPPGRPRAGAGGGAGGCGPAGSGCVGAAARARRAGWRRRAGSRGCRSPPAGKGPGPTCTSLRVPSARPGGRCSPPPRCWRWTMRRTTWRCSARYGSALRGFRRTGGGRPGSPVLCPGGHRASRGGAGRAGPGRLRPGRRSRLLPGRPSHARCSPVPPGLRGGPGCPGARGWQEAALGGARTPGWLLGREARSCCFGPAVRVVTLLTLNVHSDLDSLYPYHHLCSSGGLYICKLNKQSCSVIAVVFECK